MKPHMKIGGRYNWRGQEERLVYLGKNWSGNGYWHQFALTSNPDEVWCETLDFELESFEETSTEPTKRAQPARRIQPDLLRLSPRQERKQRKAAKRATKAARAAQWGV